jgi:Uma2 family endonuclease
MSQPVLTENTEDLVAPDISQLVIEDDTPVDNFQSEKQQRLLVEPLYSAAVLPQPFIAAANVGIFGSTQEEGIAPDAFLSLGVLMPADWSQKQNRSYLVWQFGKFPDVAIEIVSNRKGNELVTKDPDKLCKKDAYARMGIAYYAVFDPLRQIQEPEQMNGELLKVFVLTGKRYQELSSPFWLEEIGLGLTLWEGAFEEHQDIWLRWCDRQGQVIPTGAERANQEAQRANQEAQRANQEAQRADRAEALLEQERQAKAQLLERLSAMGINPDEI